MLDDDEYEKILNQTIIPEKLSETERASQYSGIASFINSNIPPYLYRFRPFTEKSLKALDKDEIWFASAQLMNDDFDARPYFNKEAMNEWIDSFFDSSGILHALQHISNMNNVPASIESHIPNIREGLHYLQNLPSQDIALLSERLHKTLNENINEITQDISSMIQSSTKIACFTEQIESDMMWGIYASNATGFALEYDFKQNIITQTNNDLNYPCKSANILCTLFPVHYGQSRIVATAYVTYLYQSYLLYSAGLNNPDGWFSSFLPCPDLFMSKKIALYKSTDWAPEKEWRLFFDTDCTSMSNAQYVKINYKPHAIYLGRKCNEISQKIITNIALEKDIPVYKMTIDPSANNYTLHAECISE